GDAARAHYERVHYPPVLAALAHDGFRSGAAVTSGGERTFSFEFEHFERSWHRLTNLIAPAEADER
ncbi:MAG: hypothetical protein JWM87_4708, partial [Candidatus Eremiobacteraeota bacterium]|nr:hypothetical protein [Candidatus Eremiobacteraeota bacterium]